MSFNKEKDKHLSDHRGEKLLCYKDQRHHAEQMRHHRGSLTQIFSAAPSCPRSGLTASYPHLNDDSRGWNASCFFGGFFVNDSVLNGSKGIWNRQRVFSLA